MKGVAAAGQGLAVGGLVEVAPEVRATLAAGGPVVALESTLITHGFAPPANLEAARLAEAAVRRSGAVPATVAIHEGRISVGLSDGQLADIARARGVPKVSRQDLAAVLGRPGWGGTTVAATMIAARLAGIAVFATGGIGGVHRGGESSMDISADLDELARTPVTVVCAGPKSILDVRRTLEVLETHGVPVIGFGTDELPGFYSRTTGLRVTARADSVAEVAALVARHGALGLGSGVLVTVPVPQAAALPADEVERVIEAAVAEVEAAGIHGPASTPAVLARVAELTAGRSVAANIALIEHDAEVAGGIAVELSRLGRRSAHGRLPGRARHPAREA